MPAYRLLAAGLVFAAAVTSAVSGSAEQNQQAKDTLVTISTETTVVTEPLDEEGYVDILAAVNERLSQGVTPDNNAAVPLRIALGLSEMDAKYRDKFDKMLGIEAAGDGIFVPLTETAKDLDIGDANEAFELLSAAHERPWTANENPTIAAWLLANEPALEMITAATQRPRFYAPYVSEENAAPQLIAVLLPLLQQSREAARILIARAMLHAGEGDLERAFEDLEATHRLARLVAQDPTLIGGLVAIAIDSMACHADVAVVTSGAGAPEELASYLERLDQLSPLPGMAERVDYVERLMFVDVVVSLARGKCDQNMLLGASADGAAGLNLLEKIPQFAMSGVDWDAMLRQSHTWYDRIAAAMQEETFAEQAAALEAIDADVKSLAEGAKSPLQIAAIVLSDNTTRGRLLGKQIGDSLIALLLPATKAASAAEHRGKMKFDLARLAVALEIYRASFGHYPESPAPLARVMRQVPQDRFSGTPLRYERREDGYVLYSTGPNGQDDGATSYISSTRNGEHVPEGAVTQSEGDDLVIRIPLPE